MSSVTQATSLRTVYASSTAPVEKQGGKGQIGGMKARQGDQAIPRAFTPKTQWQRFCSRVVQGFRSSSEPPLTDREASTAAKRFNKRHEAYSGKIANVVSRLAAGVTADITDKDVLATLRNDVKKMHSDVRWAGRTELLATRLDIELGKLDEDALNQVANTLKDASREGLTSKDIEDLQTMQRAVLRQQLSRSPLVATVLGGIKDNAPSDVSGKKQLLESLDQLVKHTREEVEGLGLPHTHKQRNEDIVGGALALAIQRQNFPAAQLRGLNQNLLNVERQLRKDDLATKKDMREIMTARPQLRLLSRVVREEFLKTKVGGFTDENLRSRMTKLGQGAAHEVSKGSYFDGDLRTDGVHKYDDEELIHPDGGRFGGPYRLGLDQTNPRLLERAVFTSQLDERLGFGVSVKTNFARHHDQLGIVMELAPGKTAKETLGAKLDGPVAQKQMIKLQLLDIITGQADRHRGNYMVHCAEDGTVLGVKAIDSDFCMGPEPDNIEKLATNSKCHIMAMPPVIDTEMLEALNKLTAEDLKQLGDGMFDDDTLKAAELRLEALKEHVRGLPPENIIDPKDWGTPRITELLKGTKKELNYTDKHERPKVMFRETSYWQRDYATMTRPFYEEVLNQF